MKLLPKKEQYLIVEHLDRIITCIWKKVLVLNSIPSSGGVVEEDIILQSIKIYAPNDEGEKVINVIGNG